MRKKKKTLGEGGKKAAQSMARGAVNPKGGKNKRNGNKTELTGETMGKEGRVQWHKGGETGWEGGPLNLAKGENHKVDIAVREKRQQEGDKVCGRRMS